MVVQIGVPIKLLHECEGHLITIELLNNDLYRGICVDTEDTMNCQLQAVTCTNGQTGAQTKLEYVYIRGSKIRYIILPDMLRNAPMFRRFDPRDPHSKVQAGLGLTRGGLGGGGLHPAAVAAAARGRGISAPFASRGSGDRGRGRGMGRGRGQ